MLGIKRETDFKWMKMLRKSRERINREATTQICQGNTIPPGLGKHTVRNEGISFQGTLISTGSGGKPGAQFGDSSQQRGFSHWSFHPWHFMALMCPSHSLPEHQNRDGSKPGAPPDLLKISRVTFGVLIFAHITLLCTP